MSVEYELTRLTIKAGGFCETECPFTNHSITDTKIRIDGNWLAWTLFESRKQPRQSDYSKKNMEGYEEQIHKFNKNVNESGFHLIISHRSPSVRNYHPDSPVPSATLEAILHSTQQLGNALVVRANPLLYITELESSYEMPIITGDGIFYSRTPNTGVIFYDTLHRNQCKIFKPGQLKSCVELDRHRLGLINSLVRSHGSADSKLMQSIRNKMVSTVDVSEYKRTTADRWDEQMLAAIWNHLRYQSHDEAKLYIVDLVEKSHHRSVRRMLDHALDHLELDRTARKLRDVIENLCDCPYHLRNRAADWLEFLHEQTKKPREISANLFSYTRTLIVSKSRPVDRLDILLRGLQTSKEEFEKQLEIFHLGIHRDIMHEFTTIKLLFVIEMKNSEKIITNEFRQATLSCLVYYQDSRREFLVDYRDQLIERINYSGHKLRLPQETFSACNPSTIKQLSYLIEMIGTFNELNALSNYPMSQVNPGKWLNPCLIHTLTNNPDLLGQQIPPEISDVYGLPTRILTEEDEYDSVILIDE